MMFDINEFLTKLKSLCIAPAGHGKTYKIAECLKYTNGTHLVLTHTNAGVSSLKDKIRKNGLSSAKYQIETIDSFAQKYVDAFYCGGDIPEQDNAKMYFSFIIQKATVLVKLKPIKDVLKFSYSGLFVDEYQDCTKKQHQFIMALANIFPIHVFGDPLQGIFGFNEEQLVNWGPDLKEFENSRFELVEPWRWKNTNPELGESLKKVRGKLENKELVDLNLFKKGIEVYIIEDKNDIFRPLKEYYRKIDCLLDTESSLLLVYPDSANLNARKKIVKVFNNRLNLVEAMDGKDFYYFSKLFDSRNSMSIYELILKIIYNIFNKSELDKWFTESKVKSKRKEKDKDIIMPIVENLDRIKNDGSYTIISNILKQIKGIPDLKCYRRELFSDLCKALEQADIQKISVFEAMKNIRNVKRRMGRKIEGKCIGTTLLTKGLEFGTVVVLNANEFKCPKNLYVALTRASKKLVVFANNAILSPYNIR